MALAVNAKTMVEGAIVAFGIWLVLEAIGAMADAASGAAGAVGMAGQAVQNVAGTIGQIGDGIGSAITAMGNASLPAAASVGGAAQSAVDYSQADPIDAFGSFLGLEENFFGVPAAITLANASLASDSMSAASGGAGSTIESVGWF